MSNEAQDGGHPPYCICLGSIWSTHKESFVVSITVQNLVTIDAVISINGSFNILNEWIETPIHTPIIGVLGRLDPLNIVLYQRNPKKAHP